MLVVWCGACFEIDTSLAFIWDLRCWMLLFPNSGLCCWWDIGHGFLTLEYLAMVMVINSYTQKNEARRRKGKARMTMAIVCLIIYNGVCHLGWHAIQNYHTLFCGIVLGWGVRKNEQKGTKRDLCLSKHFPKAMGKPDRVWKQKKTNVHFCLRQANSEKKGKSFI